MEDKYKMGIRDVNLNQSIQMQKKAEAELETHSKTCQSKRELEKVVKWSKSKRKQHHSCSQVQKDDK